MTHAEIVAALRGDHRGDDPTERHNSYAVRKPKPVVTDPRNVSRPVDYPRTWR